YRVCVTGARGRAPTRGSPPRRRVSRISSWGPESIGSSDCRPGLQTRRSKGAAMFTRREFIRGGVPAFPFSFAAPAFLSELARAQGSARRNLVGLYLAGGSD